MSDAYGAVSPFTAGLRCRCPRCGRGRLYNGMLSVADQCDRCDLDLRAQDSGDGPAVFVILVVGALAVLLALIVEIIFSPPLVVHLLYEIPFVIVLSLVLLRRFKATLIALQYRHRTAGFEAE